MPSAIQASSIRQTQTRTQATYTVKAGDSLSAIAAKVLGNANRWSEIYALNRELIGPNPSLIKVGMVLKLPTNTAPQPSAPAKPSTPSTPSTSKVDSDRDGLIDRYDAAPRDASDRRWNQAAAEEFAAFVDQHVQKLRAEGVEIDCADLAAKLLKDFCDAKGIPNPLEGKGTWYQYSPKNPGGLPNVNGPTYHLAGIHADNLAKLYTRPVNDADGDGIAGSDARGKVDVDDLRPGDILFYDWDGNGVVNHTVNVVNIAKDGTVTLAYGTYDNLRPDLPLKWENLDFLPIRYLVLKPGTEEYDQWLGEGSGLWGARRYNWMPDHQAERNAIPTEAPKPASPAPKPHPPAQPAAPEPQPTNRWERLVRILMSA